MNRLSKDDDDDVDDDNLVSDLGRTFPSHGYFSGALGPGQCGLFNLLKAYSILDPEVRLLVLQKLPSESS